MHTVPTTFVDAKSVILDEIAHQGEISFSRFMVHALYGLGYGYYRRNTVQIGRDGDFVTAPVLSALFSQCLAAQCAEIFKNLTQKNIIEFGAGTGIMAAQLLLTLQKLNQLPEQYYIIELSAAMKQAQYETIRTMAPDLLSRVVWCSTLPDRALEGVILANEVLDAMPVERFCYDQGVKESAIIFSDNMLQEKFVESNNTQLIHAVEKIKADGINFQDGYVSEINLYISGWIKSISNFFQAGVMLIIDYGFSRREYYHPDRNTGTIMCHYQHRAHSNFLLHVGAQDITAHVDFTAVAEAAVENNFDVSGFATQAAFLLNCGLLSLVENTDAQVTQKLNREIMQLTHPAEMGELFKVIALSKNYSHPLIGFSSMNQVERL